MRSKIIGTIIAIICILGIIFITYNTIVKDEQSTNSSVNVEEETEDEIVVETTDTEEEDEEEEYVEENVVEELVQTYEDDEEDKEESTSSESVTVTVTIEDTYYYDLAVLLVNEMLESMVLSDYETLLDYLENITSDDQKDDISDYVTLVENIISINELIDAINESIDNIVVYLDTLTILDSSDYMNLKQLYSELDSEYAGYYTEDIENIESILFDITNPVISGIIEDTYYVVDLTIDVYDENLKQISLIKNEIITETVFNDDYITEDGSYTLLATDKAGNYSSVTFVIDKTAPVIELFSEENYITTSYIGNVVDDNLDSVIAINLDTSEEIMLESQMILEDGTYKIIATDKAGNQSEALVCIDATSPTIDGAENDKYYKENVQIKIEDKDIAKVTISLNGNIINENVEGIDVTLEYAGTYEVIAQDEAGNITTMTFTIDKTDPEFKIFDDDEWKSSSTVGKVTDENLDTVIATDLATNEEYILSETLILEDGAYEVVATDKAGNQSLVYINVDTIAPVINDIENNAYYNENVKVNVTEKNISVIKLEKVGDSNSLIIENNDVIEDEGVYTLTVIDKSGKSTSVVFTIDKTAPSINGVSNDDVISSLTIDVTDANLESIFMKKDEGEECEVYNNSVISEEGYYTITAKDYAGNISESSFRIESAHK